VPEVGVHAGARACPASRAYSASTGGRPAAFTTLTTRRLSWSRGTGECTCAAPGSANRSDVREAVARGVDNIRSHDYALHLDRGLACTTWTPRTWPRQFTPPTDLGGTVAPSRTRWHQTGPLANPLSKYYMR
jgi:hypothetical protein